MKKITLLFATAMAFTAITANADDIDETLQFAYSDGAVISNGSEITVNAAIEDEYTGEVQLPSGLYILNTTDETAGVGLDLTISRLDNGALSCCFPGSCSSQTSTITDSDNGKGNMSAGELKNFQTEYIPVAYGTCTATFRIRVHEAGKLTAGDFVAYGPTITVNFVYNELSAGITSAAAGDDEITGYYNLSGEKLSAPQKGVNIVKYADGKTIKKTVK